MQPQPRRRFPIGTFLFLLFTGFTLLEIWLIMLLAQVTSIPFTILVVIVSAIVGSAMAKQQGLATIAKAPPGAKPAAVALAELPLQIRGFGPVKEANETAAAKRREELLAAIAAGGPALDRAAE